MLFVEQLVHHPTVSASAVVADLLGATAAQRVNLPILVACAALAD
jgi:hypothetical protein